MVEGWREEGEVGGWECECERELREEGGRDKGSWIMVLSGGDLERNNVISHDGNTLHGGEISED
jgi:hypothetical protein